MSGEPSSDIRGERSLQLILIPSASAVVASARSFFVVSLMDDVGRYAGPSRTSTRTPRWFRSRA
jgi:hypothetical protein